MDPRGFSGLVDLDFNQLPEVGGFSRDSVGKESSPLLDQELLIGEKPKKLGGIFFGVEHRSEAQKTPKGVDEIYEMSAASLSGWK